MGVEMGHGRVAINDLCLRKGDEGICNPSIIPNHPAAVESHPKICLVVLRLIMKDDNSAAKGYRFDQCQILFAVKPIEDGHAIANCRRVDEQI